MSGKIDAALVLLADGLAELPAAEAAEWIKRQLLAALLDVLAQRTHAECHPTGTSIAKTYGGFRARTLISKRNECRKPTG
jgi:hypothetical protein